MANKNMIIALVLSFIWSGLGLIYAEDMQKGIMLAVVAVICYIFQSLAWLYSLFGFILSMQLTNKSKLSMVNEKDILYEDIFLNQIFKTMKNNTKK